MEMKKQVVGYYVHDVVGNNEQCLTEFDADVLQAAEDAGLMFVAVYDDGSREVVPASTVKKPDPMVNGIALATPQYVDERTEATVEVFDALAAIVAPEVAAVSEDGTATQTADPVEAFMAALAKLKAFKPNEAVPND